MQHERREAVRGNLEQPPAVIPRCHHHRRSHGRARTTWTSSRSQRSPATAAITTAIITIRVGFLQGVQYLSGPRLHRHPSALSRCYHFAKLSVLFYPSTLPICYYCDAGFQYDLTKVSVKSNLSTDSVLTHLYEPVAFATGSNR